MLINKSRFPIKEILLIGMLPSFLKIMIYRLRGYQIGRHVRLAFGSVVIGKEVRIGDGTQIGFLSVIRAKRILLGRFVKVGATTIIDTERIEIDDDAKINEQVFIGGLSGPDSFIKLGKRTIVMQMSFLNPCKPLIVGDDSGIGGHCLLFTHGSWLSQLEGYPVTFAPITIGKNVWLPWRVFIMPGVTIGDNVVIGANSLVSKDLPSNSLAAGSPAKVIRENYPEPLSDQERAKVVRGIFDDFIRFMEYHDYTTVESSTPDGLDISFSRQKKQQILHFITARNSGSLPPHKHGHLYVLDSPHADLMSNAGSEMTIDLPRKLRRGSSEIGEEFVQFISRYGVRFDRAD